MELKGVKNSERMLYGIDLKTGKIAWEHRFGEEVNFAEKVKGGLLVGSDDGFLTLLDPEKGGVIWSLKLANKVNTFLGEFPEGFVVAFHNETFWFVSREGKLVWTLP